ncbi:unnamed protein product [Caenorhabditis angaria]|uniref:Uncharacterized protein n=1 Tax=Caenorhabditis angaria TaxID=860376 RepID=A0A9P1IPJ2_9PELO|nr:unnamed protein product [Caenorhabditis angaria]
MRNSKEWRGTTSTSRVFVQRGYQLSDELALRQIQVLERRYGGCDRAHRAATIIQRAFRDYCLRKQFQTIMNKNLGTLKYREDQKCSTSSAPTNSQRNELSLTRFYDEILAQSPIR